jgi:lysyl endopeptidase
MKKLISVLAILISFSGIAQISHGGSPYSFSNTLNQTVPTYINQNTNAENLKEEDAVTDIYKDISWRFGKVVNVNLNLNNSGIWETLLNGDRVWRLTIESPNAISINLNYSAFSLPINSTFFIYNSKTTLGAFTNSNNKVNGKFATTLLKGSKITLEYYETASEYGNGIIQISSIVHGYRDLKSQIEGFNNSGSCNINTICDTSFWGNEIRSAVMQLHSNNSRYCSGALVNNVLQNGTPYVLTADHCNPSATDIFMFNYQSPNCVTNIDGLTSQTISGCTIRANDGPSDFLLVELSSTPPSNYNVFYAGWSNINVAPTKGTGIHFPSGDVKKISHDNDLLIESQYYSIPGLNHWKINDWNSGTTEGGSSGSPLFDQNHRIVGQLHGGNAACGNDEFDFYGKLSYSWDTDPFAINQLEFWLDPGITGVNVLDGFDPNGPTLTTDALIIDVIGITSFICGDSISPKVTIRNHGTNNLTSLNINYEIDGNGINTVNWSGNLPPYGIDSLAIPTTYIPGGPHLFSVNCTIPNGINDENPLNDSLSVNFNSKENPLIATLNLTTDDWGAETSWVVLNQTNDTVIQSGGYSNVAGGQQINEDLCLSDSCFTFVMYDSSNDGICCGFGNGEFQLLGANGDTLGCAGDSTTCYPLGANNFIGDSIAFPFCLTTSTSSYSAINNTFNLYPNPTKGIINISTQSNNPYGIEIFDVLGKLVYEKKIETKKEAQIDLNIIRKGIYFISIISENERIVKRLVIN